MYDTPRTKPCRWIILLAACLAVAATAQAGLADEQQEAKDQKTEEATVDPAAAKMMLKAHQARSTWGDDFPGFAADVKVSLDGEVTRGQVTVGPDGELQLEMPESKGKEWAEGALKSIVMHRLAETRDSYEVSFANQEKNHPLGRLIKFHGGETHSLYRIKGDVITEVHRSMGKIKFTISITEVARNKEGETLPSHFNVSYWTTEKGDLISNEDYREEWIRVGGFDLPARRLRIATGDDGRDVNELVLSNHRLLEQPAAGK